MVERGFATLAVMSQSWENFIPEETEQIESSEKWISGRTENGKSLSALLEQAWLAPVHPVVSLIFFPCSGRNLTKCLLLTHTQIAVWRNLHQMSAIK